MRWKKGYKMIVVKVTKEGERRRRYSILSNNAKSVKSVKSAQRK